jgi:hypothetical protein
MVFGERGSRIRPSQRIIRGNCPAISLMLLAKESTVTF